MKTIQWDDFEKVFLAAGTIVHVEDFPEAKKPAYKIKADFGKHGIKKLALKSQTYIPKKN